MVIKKQLAEKIHRSPQTSGVYIFKNKSGSVLYVGKAINLKKRLLYYTKDRTDLYSKTATFLEQAEQLNWIEVRNDLEAILLEMNLIRTLKPKYNSVNKDDKRPLFIHFTNDPLPRVRTARLEIAGTGEYIGPFPSSQKLRIILNRLRRIFPYCSCKPNKKRPCMFSDLGLCNPSPPAITTPLQRKQYKRNISKLRLFLLGNINTVIKTLQKEMVEYSQKMEYEEAGKIKNQIIAIELILSDKHEIKDYLSDDLIVKHLRDSQNKALAHFLGTNSVSRIEGYDIANTNGTNPVASMVVFEHGLPNTSEYRKFKIRDIHGPNDPLMMYRAIQRRLNHPEWVLPDVILVDGGKTQVKAAIKAVAEAGIIIPVVGLSKRFEQLVVPKDNDIKVLSLPQDTPHLTLLRAVRDEAHRFSTTYHKKLRQKDMLKS